MTIGELIKQERKKKGITQNELAKRLGVTRSAVGQFEQKDSHLRGETLKRIAAALDVPVYEFSLNEGERIKAIRELEGLTQEELGKKVGLSAETISGIESQNFRPSNDLIVELSKALNISHVALIPGSISTQETSKPVSVREDSIYSLILIIRKLYSCVSEPEYNQDTFTDIHFVKNECLYHISGRDLHELIPLVDGLVSAFVEQKKVCDQQQDPA